MSFNTSDVPVKTGKTRTRFWKWHNFFGQEWMLAPSAPKPLNGMRYLNTRRGTMIEQLMVAFGITRSRASAIVELDPEDPMLLPWE